ncbi:MAG TPA: hypothetical protein VMF08_13465 [Candidatus Sulfotelmatobacter sp.]|nr:hypothetical protein [Candidatus Sulfotelmatobacter sp.]
MKTRFNLFSRAGVFYTEDTATGKQTKDKTEASPVLLIPSPFTDSI